MDLLTFERSVNCYGLRPRVWHHEVLSASNRFDAPQSAAYFTLSFTSTEVHVHHMFPVTFVFCVCANPNMYCTFTLALLLIVYPLMQLLLHAFPGCSLCFPFPFSTPLTRLHFHIRLCGYASHYLNFYMYTYLYYCLDNLPCFDFRFPISIPVTLIIIN